MIQVTDENIRKHIGGILDDAYQIRVKDLVKAIELAEEALHASDGIYELSDLHAKALSHLSLFYMIRGEYSKAIEIAEKAIEEFDTIGDDHGVASAMYNIAGVYYKTDNFHSGLIYLIDCLGIYKKYKDYHNQARVLKSMGTIYEYFGDTARAIESYEKSVECALKIGDKNLQSNAYNPLSGIYLNRGDIDNAMKLITRAIDMKEETGDVRGLAFSIYGRGKVFTRMGRFKEAEADFLEALRIHDEMGEKLGWGMAMIKLGTLYFQMGLNDKCKTALNEGLSFTKKNKISFLNFKAYHKLYELYKSEGKSEEALQYLEAYLKERDYVINAQTLHVVEAYQTLSEKQSLEMEANLQKERVQISEQKNRELDAFFLKVSHDLKGPISSIIGLGDIVKEKISDPEALKYFDIYKKKVLHINNMLDELVRITRVDHADECLEPIHFEEVVKDNIESLAYLENFSQVNVESHVTGEIKYTAEWALVNTILQNLIENGIKYADPEKENPILKIDIHQKGENIIIEVEDNGIGMNEEVRDRAFEMFYKANKLAIGSGLGLYLLHRAVQKLNGQINLESAVGKGTSAIVILPVER
ncbi:tetratricopeptide repeat-containing sensor histidine kinase [Marinoscillum sp. MHG1-6]|uniref:tetratricopeptide repeat-containing sensor histidine kinase n=1 Tax=Marinoscillum sp. MHG1-6 TaxID=2959627 RepID=UPI002158227D|nr:tetratricopeptide repeat-containing sensor histidine kinase [Marinoscillum sp. MHG1-6]